MANSDKNIIITPNISSTTADPKIAYSGANATVGAQTITLYVYPDNSGTLSWEGSAGQLMSVTNTLTGTIFAVNDVSGIPSITVQDTGQVTLAPYTGNVIVGSLTDANTAKVQVTGAISATGNILGDNLKSNSVSIATNTTDAVFVKDDNITSWDYSGKSKSVTAEETVPSGIFFKSDGTEMYIIGSTGDDVNQYTLSTAWDVTTATFTRVSATIGETAPTGVFFKPDGTVMYVIGSTNDTVREFSVSTAWDVSTIAFVRDFSVTAQDTIPQDIWFKPDGTKMYMIGSTNDRVYEYNLGTAWNVSTATFLQFFSVATQESAPIAVNFNSDGTRMYIMGQAGLDINRYTLSIPWDISTAVFFNNFYIGFQETGPTGLFIDLGAGAAYVVGTTADTVFQYNTITDGIELVSDSGLFIDGSLYTNKNLVVTSGARIDGALSVSGAISGPVAATTISATSTINLAGTTTSVTALGTSATTGTTTIGGLLQTGEIIVGRSTSAQTLNLGTGATVSGNTKTVNIGTGGVSGSTTNITVGTAVAGSTTNITINGGIINGQGNGVGNIGAAASTFNTIFAKATSAQYADVAEKYQADADYPPGTVLIFGGAQEVTVSGNSHSSDIAGVVSTDPAYIMNSGLDSGHVATVALLGRVPCQVVGLVRKGQCVVASDQPGTACALDPDQYQPGCIIGKALEDYNNDLPGTIEVVVGRL